MRKLSRKEIAEGLQTVPIETVLLGASNPKGIKLTAKQKRFAEEIAKGETKAGAYRKAYDSKGSPRTASRRGQELAKKGAVSAQVDAMRLALERQKYTTPAALRALVIDKLTEKAIDESIPPAQQLKALQLLGTVTEIAAFTARSETVRVTDSAEIRSKLVKLIEGAVKKVSATDAKLIEGDDLLAEIAQGRAAASAEPPADADLPPADPTAPAPPAHDSADSQSVIHTIPLTQSSPQSKPHLPDSNGVEMESNNDTQRA